MIACFGAGMRLVESITIEGAGWFRRTVMSKILKINKFNQQGINMVLKRP